MGEIDNKKGKEGNELDEFQAHRFLEGFGETLSVAAMRNALREIDLDFNKNVALIEFLIYKFKKDINIKYLVDAPQVCTLCSLSYTNTYIIYICMYIYIYI